MSEAVLPSQNLIYGLVDPATKLVRYVGQSTSGLRRPRAHTTPAELRKDSHKTRWLRLLLSAGLTYEITVLEEVATRQALADAERYWIAYGRACGWPLTNLTDGGDSSVGWTPSAETRAKIGAANRGRVRTEEHRKKISEALKSRAFTAEHKAKLSARARARPRNSVGLYVRR